MERATRAIPIGAALLKICVQKHASFTTLTKFHPIQFSSETVLLRFMVLFAFSYIAIILQTGQAFERQFCHNLAELFVMQGFGLVHHKM